MGRIHFYHTVWRKAPTEPSIIEPLEGVEATVHKIVNGSVGIGSEPAFSGRLGVSAATLFTDENGVVSFWLDPSDYIVSFADPELPERIAPFEVGVSGVSGDLQGILMSQLPLAIQASAAMPGDLKAVAYTDPDDGWLLCDGSLLSRLEFADLFDRIGTSFNTSGEAGTQFRLPDLRGRVPIGADLSAGRLSASDLLGNSGGTEKFTFTADHLPDHGHAYGNNDEVVAPGAVPVIQQTITDAPWVRQQFSGTEDFNGSGYFYPMFYNISAETYIGASHTGSVVNAWDHDEEPNTNDEMLHYPIAFDNPTETIIPNLQPYQIVNWMIKT